MPTGKIITGDLSLRPIVTGRASMRPVVTASRVSMRPVVTGKVGAGPAVTVGAIDGVLALPLPMVQFSAQGTVVSASRVDGALGITLPMVQFSASGMVETPAVVGLIDSFNRGDNASSMSTSDNGKVWSGAGYGIQSNRPYRSSGSGFVFATADAEISDGTGEIELVTPTSYNYIALRYVDDNNLLLVEVQDDGFTRLYRRVAGAFTNLGAGTVATGDMVGWVLAGTSVQILRNGTPIISVTESAHATATRFGIGYSGVHAGRWDNMEMVP